jgi:hypothetical protein
MSKQASKSSRGNDHWSSAVSYVYKAGNCFLLPTPPLHQFKFLRLVYGVVAELCKFITLLPDWFGRSLMDYSSIFASVTIDFFAITTTIPRHRGLGSLVPSQPSMKLGTHQRTCSGRPFSSKKNKAKFTN